ncbi:MAG: STAS domain-containing protein [Desulfobacterales bacterium]|nr:MAG: STAS domain-containing protein [Desulfobacterales bacterium]
MALKVASTLKSPGVTMISPMGSVDTNSHSILEKRVDSILEGRPDVIIFDMEHLDYINSMGIRVLIKTQKALKRAGGKIVFMNLQPQIKKVFDILNALPSMKVFANIQELDEYLDAMQKAAR